MKQKSLKLGPVKKSDSRESNRKRLDRILKEMLHPGILPTKQTSGSFLGRRIIE